MSYQKPTLRIYDKTLTLVALIDDYETCSWGRGNYEVQESTVEINYNLPNAAQFVLGYFVQYGSDARDFGVITAITDPVDEDGKGSQIRDITIYDARYIFKRRQIMYLNSTDTYNMTGAGGAIIKALIDDQCGPSCTDANRIFGELVVSTATTTVGSEYTISEKYSNLLDVLQTVATQTLTGWWLEFDADNKKLNLRTDAGTDRSESVIFSTEYDSIKSAKFADSNESFANLVYVGGSGSGTSRTIYTGYNDTAEPAGLDRYEAWDNASSLTEEPELENEASSVLAQYKQTSTVSGEGLTKCAYVYKTDYDVGDYVLVRFTGHEAVVKILNITESWQYGEYTISFEFGKPVKTVADQISGIANTITTTDSTSDSSTNTSGMRAGVMSFDLSSADQTMTSSQCIYNILELAGTLTANRTMTLYLDITRLYGRKIYTLWITAKGNTTTRIITLTTGISDTKTVTVAVLTSVTPVIKQVYVDATGNVVEIIGSRVDTAAHWTSLNPVLRAGDMGMESDTGFVKVGDGATVWASLAYATMAGRTAVTTTSDTDKILIGHDKYITAANRQTDIASRSLDLTAAKALSETGINVLDAYAVNQLLSSANTWTGDQQMSSIAKSPALTATFTTTGGTYTYINICTLLANIAGSILLRIFGNNIEDKLLIKFEQTPALEANNNFTVEYSKYSLLYGPMNIYSYVSLGVRTIYLGILPYDTSVNIEIYQDFNPKIGSSITYNMTQSSSVPTYTFSQSLTAYPCGFITKQLIQQYDDTGWIDIRTTVSWNASLVTLSQAYIKRVGNTVNIKIVGTYNGGTITTDTALMTGALPAKYIPIIAHNNNCTINSNSLFVARFYIQKDGIIYIGNTTMSSGLTFQWEVTYLV